MKKPKIAVWKFASCDGCQLTFLDCEDDLMALAAEVRIAHFLEASSRVEGGPYDISFIEGSITTTADAARIREIREKSGLLVAIGACATAGGVQALRNTRDLDLLIRSLYPNPDYIDALATSTAIADHVAVDVELRGCPISKAQLLALVAALLAGRRPDLPDISQCVECKQAGTICVMVAGGTPCLGPVTRGGCGNLCPQVGRGCYGCFGPTADANTAALAERLAAFGMDGHAIVAMFKNFNAGAGPFAAEAASHD